MREFVALSQKDRSEGLALAASKNKDKLPAYVLEKDYWVTYTLDTIFNHIDVGHRFQFKGGTTLSKCFNLIKRFSEDIDLSLNMEDLGFGGDNAPGKAPSKNQKKKRIEQLEQKGLNFTAGTLLPALEDKLNKDLNEMKYGLEIDPDKEEDILFHYPKSLTRETYGDDDYVKPVVRIETGTKSAHRPQLEVEINAQIGETFPEYNTPIRVVVLEPSRTFWEKITYLHSLNSANDPKKIRNHLSRHIYDVVMLHRDKIGREAIKDTALLKLVADHKSVYFASSWANFEEAKPGTLKLKPTEDLIPIFKEDYSKMKDMFSGSPPDFDGLIKELEEMERIINTE